LCTNVRYLHSNEKYILHFLESDRVSAVFLSLKCNVCRLREHYGVFIRKTWPQFKVNETAFAQSDWRNGCISFSSKIMYRIANYMQIKNKLLNFNSSNINLYLLHVFSVLPFFCMHKLRLLKTIHANDLCTYFISQKWPKHVGDCNNM
jgi:hypothetical protein